MGMSPGVWETKNWKASLLLGLPARQWDGFPLDLGLEKFFRYDGEAPFWGHARD